ncbi:cadherin domain-containing protein [Piscinibacter sp. XHJ-5]|uniref:beta strand repeat-containing protein n=1 Tax=Piscinibacter sp. XHJ-5 TaxID=3037797 RepID=UPI002453689F|nr:cadherin domain-containing protein [Piscinibacter sp. XHJ-5]
MGINSTSFTNTPQAGDDNYTSASTGLTEDSLFVVHLAVMANDLGGAAKTLYSLDNGTNSTGVLSPTDLLTQDIVRTEALTADRSAQGAKIWITVDGKVGYDAATLSAAFQEQLQHLSAGQYLSDSFTYAIRLGNGTLSWATATVQIAGVNDAPVVTGAVSAAALEDGASVTLKALANASDVDSGATLSVTNLPASLPPGVTYDALTRSFTLDPSHSAFQHLAAGDHTTVTVNYGVTDGTATTAASVSWTVTGINDAPVVTGAVTAAALEDGASVTLNALTNASDVDSGATLSVTNLPASLPPGVTYDALTRSFTLDPSHSAFQHLAAGDHTTVTVNYGVTDGTATTAASVSWTVTGTNDAPVITSNEGGATATLSVDENSTTVTTVSATDADDGATQAYSIVGGSDASLFTIDAATGALSFISGPNSEAPTDSDSDNVYHVTVRVFDGISFDDQAVAVTVHDVNEFAVTTPADTNAAANAVNENAAVGTVVGVTAHASDADATTHGVSYSLIDNAGGKFAIDATTGVVTVAGAIDREVDASLNITVRATSEDGSTADQAFTIAVGDVDEFDVTAPADTNAAANAVNENAAVGTVVGVTASASDADATTHGVTYSLIDNAGGKFAIDATTGIVTVAGAIDREVDASLNITVRATSEDGSTADQAFTIAVGDVDEFDVSAPADTNAAANAVNENAAVGTVVGVTAHASDADATTHGVSYSLIDNAGGKFAIDATTGVVTVAGAIDREVDASLNITVRATSEDGSTADQAFTIAVGDVDEFDVSAPADTNAAANAVNENAAVGTVVGVTAHASDADATTHGVTYSLIDNAGGKFAINSTTGIVTVAGAIDREVDASLNITVRATSEDGSTADQAFTIAVGDVDEFDVSAPADTNAAANAVNENAAVGTVVGVTAHASDADATTHGVTYSLIDNAGGKFAINSTTGIVTVAGAIDREVDASLNITVRATSEDGSTADQAFTIAVGDVDEFDVSAPADTNAAANAVNENAAVGTVVGVTAHASDADATTHGVSYSLIDNAGGKFAIDATTGVVTVAGAIDREVDASLNITVRATSEDGSTADQAFTIAVGDVDEFDVSAPADTNAAANAVNENAAVGTVVGVTASASDADATTHGVTYSLIDNAGGKFAIDATTGVVTVAGAIDREVDASLNITVRATSEDGSTADQAFTIAVGDVDEFDVTAPADTNAAANAVNENAAVGTVVGVTAHASDADATTHGVTYSLIDNAGGKFAIDANTGVVTVAGAIDREVDASLNITVRATSEDGSTADQAFTIAVGDVDEFDVSAPADTNAAANAVNENAAVGTVVGVTAHASDADATTHGVTYSLIDNAGGKFAIDATTGVVTVAGAIDREVDASLNITVRATSEDGSTADQAFTIAVGDVDEFDVTAPADTNAAANAVNENAAVGTVVGVTAHASDADATTHGVTYSLIDNAGGKFAIDANTGVVTVAGAIDREVDASLNITVRATSEDGSTADQAFTIAVGDVDEFDVTAPADTNAAANAVNENAAVGTVVGVTAHASDADATTHGVSYSLIDNAGGKFAIDATTGVVTVAGAIDREVDASLNITVRATSEDGSTADQAFTIAVGDVDEFDVTAPADTNAAANAVNENAAVGTVVGVTAHASDADATTHGVTYSLIDNAGGKFAINATTGIVTVAGAIDREAHANLGITVRATSLDGSTADQSFTIAINDLNDNVPVFSSGTTGSEPENTAPSNVVYDANATDADSTAAHNAITYSLTGVDSGLFSIDASSGEVRFLASPNHEAPADANGDNAYQIVVHANDGTNDTAQAVTVTVTDVVENHAPTDLGLVITNAPGGNSLPGAGTVLGTVSPTDPDAGDSFTFSLLGGSSSGFSLNASTGALTTTTGLAEKTVYTLDIQVKDAAAATYHEVFNIITGTNGTNAAADDNPLPSGGQANPVLAGDDVLYGSGGNDVIYGGSGNDWIFGQNGLDRLIGGAGNDTLSGGNQSDTFVFLASDGGGTDTVVGFAVGGGSGDVLDISNVLAGSGYTTATASQFIHLLEAGGNTALQVDLDGSGSAYSFQDIAVLQGVTGLNLGTLLASGVIDTTP